MPTMPAHLHPPSAILSFLLLADVALHATAIGLCDHLLAGGPNSDTSRVFSLAVSNYTRSLQVIARTLLVLSSFIQCALFVWPISLAWVRFLGTKFALWLIAFDKAATGPKRLKALPSWRQTVSWCNQEVGNGAPERPWSWDGKIVGWWIGSLIIKILITGIATFFTGLNYVAISSATSATLYTSDPNVPNNPYDQLIQLSTTHLVLSVMHLLILVWSLFQMYSACYSIRNGYTAMGLAPNTSS